MEGSGIGEEDVVRCLEVAEAFFITYEFIGNKNPPLEPQIIGKHLVVFQRLVLVG